MALRVRRVELFVCSMLVSAICRADLRIEQEVVTIARSPQQQQPTTATSVLTIAVKGSKVLIRGASVGVKAPPNIDVIADTDTGVLTTRMHDDKKYLVTTPEQFEQAKPTLIAALEQSFGPIPEVRPVLKPTGKKEKINGYDAEEYVATTSRFKITYWVAPALRKYASVFARRLPYASGPVGVLVLLWMPDPATVDGVVVRSEVALNAPRVGSLTILNLRSIHEVSLPDSTFTVPPTYQRVEAPWQ